MDVRGSVSASGSGTFNKLNLSLAEQAYATSDTDAVATGSAGTAFIKQYQTELTISNPNVNENSLVYITPVGSTSQVVSLIRRVAEDSETLETEGSFTVGISQPILSDLKFNWIIVN